MAPRPSSHIHATASLSTCGARELSVDTVMPLAAASGGDVHFVCAGRKGDVFSPSSSREKQQLCLHVELQFVALTMSDSHDE
jgi:hypothetical protein